MITLPARSEVPVEATWSVETIFPGDEEWEAECAALVQALPRLERFRGRLGEGPEILAEFLAASEDVRRRLGRVTLYALLRGAVDATDQVASALGDRARGLQGHVDGALAFAEPELVAVGVDTLRRWVDEDPRLAVYRHHFDRLARRAPHVRSAEVEEVLSLATDPLGAPGVAHGILANAELRFRPAVGSDGTEHEVAQGTHVELSRSRDRDLRRTAWESYADAHLEVARTMAACLAGGIKRDVFLARVRRYQDSLEAALASQELPAEVFHQVLAAFRDNLPIWHRYWRLRRRLLGGPLREYDLQAPLARPVAIPFERAVELICSGLSPLGEEYVAVLRRGVLEERWVDRLPNRGKRQGAFSAGVPGTHPFVFVSYQESVGSLSTLAHELGHAMHRHYTSSFQPYVYSSYGPFLAEVASNFHQAMVRAHLLATEHDTDFQVAVLEEAMGNFHRYFLVMPTLARFELEIHQRVERGLALTADGMSELMADLLAEAYGGEVEMDRRRSGITWATFSTHLYRNFYPFQYATGIAGAHALAQGVLAGGRDVAERYLGFIAAGSSRYPLDLLREAGVDLATREPVDRAFAILAGYVDRLERLLTGPTVA
jgi:oligoendopeptidase F